LTRTEPIVSEISRLVDYAEKLFDAMKGSEACLEEATRAAEEELKRVYVEEAKKLADAITQSKLRKKKREESRLGNMIVKNVYGLAAAALAHGGENDETTRTVQEGLYEGYELDETEKKNILQAFELVKHRVEEQTGSMKPDDFLRSLKNSTMRQVINAMFREELSRLAASAESSNIA
jgi:hypothetical protein